MASFHQLEVLRAGHFGSHNTLWLEAGCSPYIAPESGNAVDAPPGKYNPGSLIPVHTDQDQSNAGRAYGVKAWGNSATSAPI